MDFAIASLRHHAPWSRRLLVTAHRKGRIRQVVAAHPGSLSGPRKSWKNGRVFLGQNSMD